MPLERFYGKTSSYDPDKDRDLAECEFHDNQTDEELEQEEIERIRFYTSLAKRPRVQHPKDPEDYVAIARCLHNGADTLVPDSKGLLEIVRAMLDLVDARRGAIKALGRTGPFPDLVLTKTIIAALFNQIEHMDKIIASLTRGER